MIRMRTGHKTLESMIETAEKRGVSRRGNWEVSYTEYKNQYVNGKYYKLLGYYRIYHWGTLILEIDMKQYDYHYAPIYTAPYVYGQSVSDARGINAVLTYFGIGTRYTYKPVNGGFQKVENN